MNEVVVVSAVRTAVGRMGGALKDVAPEDLSKIVIAEALKRSQVEPEAVDEVIFGQAKQSADAANLARVAALKAGLPVEVPAYTVMRQCGSGLQAVNNAAQAIMSGVNTIVVAGGVESMSTAPYYLRGARYGYGAGNAVLVDSNTESQPRSQPCEIYGNLTMGLTAENVGERWGMVSITRYALSRRSLSMSWYVLLLMVSLKRAAPRRTSFEQVAFLRLKEEQSRRADDQQGPDGNDGRQDDGPADSTTARLKVAWPQSPPTRQTQGGRDGSALTGMQRGRHPTRRGRSRRQCKTIQQKVPAGIPSAGFRLMRVAILPAATAGTAPGPRG